ncbi:MAG TPA: trehalose-phosphatase [Anaeromyxobacter sp.]|nr:trehalose-phosphatase [Anaeromyxobacter sp.]
MRPILSEAGSPVLDALARERALLVFDFDGTLAPIVPRPADAAMRAETRTLLRVASLLYPCAVVSGRARADVASRLEGVPLLAVVGNHGAEAGFGPVDRSPRREVVAWAEALRAELGDAEGIELEDKGLSLAIHYRRAPDRAAARRRVRDAVAGLPAARVFGGRAVANVVPADAPDKGAAVAELLHRIGWRRALYAGDDVTDEDAFATDGVAVAVRVGRTHASRAGWYLPAQREVDALLRALIEARRKLDRAGECTDALLRATGA